MTPEQRLDRAEYILVRLAKNGREVRSEFRQRINMLIDAQMRNEETRRVESQAVSEKINILIDAQVKNEEAWRAESHIINEQIKGLAVAQAELTKSQKLTDRALRAFINSLRKGGNGIHSS
jgi:hypothetical protein